MSNKLDEIIKSVWEIEDFDIQLSITLNPDVNRVKQCMIAAMKMVIEEAAENGKTIYIEPDGCATGDYYDIDKQSITDTINKYL